MGHAELIFLKPPICRGMYYVRKVLEPVAATAERGEVDGWKGWGTTA